MNRDLHLPRLRRVPTTAERIRRRQDRQVMLVALLAAGVLVLWALM